MSNFNQEIDCLSTAFEMLVSEEMMDLRVKLKLKNQWQWSPANSRLKSLILEIRSILDALKWALQNPSIPFDGNIQFLQQKIINLKIETIFFAKRKEVERSSSLKRSFFNEKIRLLQHEVPFYCFKQFSIKEGENNENPLPLNFDFQKKWRTMSDEERIPFRKMSEKSLAEKEEKEDSLLHEIKLLNKETVNHIEMLNKEEEEEKKTLPSYLENFNLEDSLRQKKRLINLLIQHTKEIGGFIKMLTEMREKYLKEIEKNTEKIDMELKKDIDNIDLDLVKRLQVSNTANRNQNLEIDKDLKVLEQKLVEKRNDLGIVFNYQSFLISGQWRKTTTEFFGTSIEDLSENCDIEDMTGSSGSGNNLPVVNSKRKRATNESANGLDKSWRELLGPPPPMGKPGVEREVWIRYHKKKWEIQLKQKKQKKSTA